MPTLYSRKRIPSEFSQLNLLPWKQNLIQLAYRILNTREDFRHPNFLKPYLQDQYPIFNRSCLQVKPQVQITYAPKESGFAMTMDRLPLCHAGKIVFQVNLFWCQNNLLKTLHNLLHEFQHVLDQIHDLELTHKTKRWPNYEARWAPKQDLPGLPIEAFSRLPTEHSAYLKSVLNMARLLPTLPIDSLDMFLHFIGYNNPKYRKNLFLRSTKQSHHLMSFLAKHGFPFPKTYSGWDEKKQQLYIESLRAIVCRDFLKNV